MKPRFFSTPAQFRQWLAPEYEKQFRRNKKVWSFLEAQPPGYKRLVTFWVMSAKQEETRTKRLQKLIESSETGARL